MLGPIKIIKGKALPLPGNDIDTDRIIPARFLRCVTFEGLGDNAFYDERFSGDGKALDHPMNDQRHDKAKIILSGNNFGCGSSREHAPQAIKRAGFEAVIAESFAEIFYGNSSLIGLLCATLEKGELEELVKTVREAPDTEAVIDVEEKTLKAAGRIYPLTIRDSLRTAFLNGTYDTLPELMNNREKTDLLHKRLPPAAYKF